MIRSLKSLSLRAQWLYVDFLIDRNRGLTDLFNEAGREAAALHRACVAQWGNGIGPQTVVMHDGEAHAALDVGNHEGMLIRLDAAQMAADRRDARYYFTRALVGKKAFTRNAVAEETRAMIGAFKKERAALAL